MQAKYNETRATELCFTCTQTLETKWHTVVMETAAKPEAMLQPRVPNCRVITWPVLTSGMECEQRSVFLQVKVLMLHLASQVISLPQVGCRKRGGSLGWWHHRAEGARLGTLSREGSC